MTPEQQHHFRSAVERDEIREAVTTSAARASIDRMLGEELIAAAREVATSWREYRDLQTLLAGKHSQLRNTEARIFAAVAKIEELVGDR